MIDWSSVEVGDVYETRGGDRVVIESFSEGDCENHLYPIEINEWPFTVTGQFDPLTEGPLDIVAIHKPGTVGALSHEERSRLWDEFEEHGIQIAIHGHDFIAWSVRGHEAIGPTRLEAVMKCVAAIEAQQKQEQGNG